VNPTLQVIRLSGGPSIALGAGVDPVWSPDDRFIGYVKNQSCTKSQCFGIQLVASSQGGVPTSLTSGVSNWLVHEEWQARPGGYEFDRWVLNKQGGVVRHVADVVEQVDAWSPNGQYAVVQSLHPYVAGPVRLRLVSSSGIGRFIYATVPTGSCLACTRVYYQVVWDRSGSWFAFLSPEVITPQKTTVKPLFNLYDLMKDKLVHVPLPAFKDAELLGVTREEENVLLRIDTNVYRYDVHDGVLIPLAQSVDRSYTQGYLPSIATHW
jgi:hypothetical protein